MLKSYRITHIMYRRLKRLSIYAVLQLINCYRETIHVSVAFLIEAIIQHTSGCVFELDKAQRSFVTICKRRSATRPKGLSTSSLNGKLLLKRYRGPHNSALAVVIRFLYLHLHLHHLTCWFCGKLGLRIIYFFNSRHLTDKVGKCFFVFFLHYFWEILHRRFSFP